jgi:DNA-binding beta-propeller fold protein YncE
VATDAVGDVYVTDLNNQRRIQKFTSTGTYLTQWGSPGSGDGQFNFPYGVATDADGNVYVADTFNHRIQKFTNTGTYLCEWGSPGSDDGQFDGPFAVATDDAGNVYVTDRGNSRIQKFNFGSTPTNAASWGHLKSLYR